MMYLTSLREDEKILENLYESLIERKIEGNPTQIIETNTL